MHMPRKRDLPLGAIPFHSIPSSVAMARGATHFQASIVVAHSLPMGRITTRRIEANQCARDTSKTSRGGFEPPACRLEV